MGYNIIDLKCDAVNEALGTCEWDIENNDLQLEIEYASQFIECIDGGLRLSKEGDKDNYIEFSYNDWTRVSWAESLVSTWNNLISSINERENIESIDIVGQIDLDDFVAIEYSEDHEVIDELIKKGILLIKYKGE